MCGSELAADGAFAVAYWQSHERLILPEYVGPGPVHRANWRTECIMGRVVRFLLFLINEPVSGSNGKNWKIGSFCLNYRE